jgi:hypothetical protein
MHGALMEKKTRNSTRLSSPLFRDRGHRLSLFCARGALGSFFNGKSLDRRTLSIYRFRHIYLLSYLIIHYLLISTINWSGTLVVVVVVVAVRLCRGLNALVGMIQFVPR